MFIMIFFIFMQFLWYMIILHKEKGDGWVEELCSSKFYGDARASG
jgi:hypothetical protein